MRYLAALIFWSIILVFSFNPAMAGCLSPETVKSRIAKNLPDAQIALASGDMVGAYMQLYNSIPPPSRLPTPDQLLFAKSTKLPTVVVITGFVKGCRSGGFIAGRKLHKLILDKIIKNFKVIKA